MKTHIIIRFIKSLNNKNTELKGIYKLILIKKRLLETHFFTSYTITLIKVFDDVTPTMDIVSDDGDHVIFSNKMYHKNSN